MTDSDNIHLTTDSTADAPESVEQTVYVRPKGYVEPFAVVEQIGDRDVFVGNYRAAEPHCDATAQHRAAEPHCDATAQHRAAEPHRDDQYFDAVLSVGSDSYPATTHHHPLVDGSETDWPEFAAAVDTAREPHRADDSLLVHCKAGISRSVAVLATTLAAEESRSFHDALSLVQDARPHAIPHPALHRLGVIYLAARGTRNDGDTSSRQTES